MRVLAGYNVESFPRVLTWPLRDALLAYEHHVREQVREQYYLRVLVYAVQSPFAKKGQLKPPKMPRILST